MVSIKSPNFAKSNMPHSTFQRQNNAARKSIEERFQAGLQLQALYALPIYQLPAELMLNILDRVELRDYPPLITATWHLLRHKGIAPTWPTIQLKRILVEPRCGFYGSFEDVIDQSREDEGYLPFNVRKNILQHLAPGPSFFTTFTNVGLRLRGGFERLPTELREAIFRHFDPVTNVIVALACFRFSDRDIEWLTHEKV